MHNQMHVQIKYTTLTSKKKQESYKKRKMRVYYHDLFCTKMNDKSFTILLY